MQLYKHNSLGELKTEQIIPITQSGVIRKKLCTVICSKFQFGNLTYQMFNPIAPDTALLLPNFQIQWVAVFLVGRATLVDRFCYSTPSSSLHFSSSLPLNPHWYLPLQCRPLAIWGLFLFHYKDTKKFSFSVRGLTSLQEDKDLACSLRQRAEFRGRSQIDP